MSSPYWNWDASVYRNVTNHNRNTACHAFWFFFFIPMDRKACFCMASRVQLSRESNEQTNVTVTTCQTWHRFVCLSQHMWIMLFMGIEEMYKTVRLIMMTGMEFLGGVFFYFRYHLKWSLVLRQIVMLPF